jgi:Fe-S cluster assembly ATP-binding protein
VSGLELRGLRASVGERPMLDGVDLAVAAGEVHAIMGPNGSGKSTLAHVLAGRPGPTATGGTATLDGIDLLSLQPHERARAGLFLGLQHPIEVPGVTAEAALSHAGVAVSDLPSRVKTIAAAIGLRIDLLDRPLNVDLSGGERKRSEIVQLCVLRPKFAVLDEIDSGLDVDALRAVARRIERATQEWGLGVLAVTHFQRLLVELRADAVHVLVDGSIVATGGAELAQELEATGYGAYSTHPER